MAARIGAAGLVWLLLIVVSFLYVDRPLAEFVHDHLREQVTSGGLREQVFWHVTGLAESFEPAAVWGLGILAAAVLVRRRNSPLARFLLAAAIAAVVADFAKQELKFLFGRTWPETWIDDNPSFIRDGVYGFFPLHGGRGWGSFPSGHTTLITAPMAVLWFAAPRLRWLAVLLPALMMLVLIGFDYHFLSDCLAGAGLGIAAGAAAAFLLRVRPLPRLSA